jgi:hypothetical protein
MKRKITLLSALLFLVIFKTYSQVPKKIVVEHFTNTNCSICATRNPGFYTNLNNQQDVLHIAIHPSSPYASCLLYQQNSTANDARTNYYGIYGGTPRLVINGNVISGSANYSLSSMFTPYQSLTTPASIRIVQQKYGSDSIHSTIIIKTEALHSLPGLSLFVALAEDTVFYTGGNGETSHRDVFRKTLSPVTGANVTLPATVGDSIILNYTSLSNGLWDFSRIYTIAILQQTVSKNLVQAEAAGVSDGLVSTGINQIAFNKEIFAFPNPTNGSITLKMSNNYSLVVSVYDLQGKFIFEKSISKNESQVDLSSLPPATYLLKVNNGKEIHSQLIEKK